MARPQRCRRIDGYPDCWLFFPDDGRDDPDPILLTLDEYEAIRLIDHENLTQEQCAARMGVARTTVTSIYESARRKLAQMLVEGRQLRITGGNYRIIGQRSEIITQKGIGQMRIAVTYENGEIFQHFGHTAQFKLYDAENGEIQSALVADTQGSGHGALAGLLRQWAVDALICGGIGPGAQMALAEAGIQLYAGISGSADAAAKALAAGELPQFADATCDHHHNHGEGDSCSDHGCGERSCHS